MVSVDHRVDSIAQPAESTAEPPGGFKVARRRDRHTPGSEAPASTYPLAL